MATIKRITLLSPSISCPLNCNEQYTKHNILQHFYKKHSQQILENSAILTYNASHSNLQTYIINTNDSLFLLYVKICTIKKKIFHAVRILEDTVKVKEFTYVIEIKHGGKSTKEERQVVSQNCNPIEEQYSVIIDMNLNDFKDSTFTITLNQHSNCPECGEEVLEFFYRRKNKWYCEKCAPAKQACVNQSEGCNLFDITTKNQKHQWNFCEFTKYCWICDTTCGALILENTLTDHYLSEHKDVTYEMGSTWRVSDLDSVFGRRCLISSDIGTIVCWYGLFDVKFELEVYIPVQSKHLREFQCFVKVSCPKSGHFLTFKPEAVYTGPCDWYVRIERNELPWQKAELDVCIDVKHIKM